MSILKPKKNEVFPFMMGGAMGLMMLWMAHDAFTGGTGIGAGALIIFVLAHVAMAAAVVIAAVFATRLSLRARTWVSRLHRPSWRHVGLMLTGAAISAGSVHVAVHAMGVQI